MPARARVHHKTPTTTAAVLLFSLALVSSPISARASDLVQLPKHLAPSHAHASLVARQGGGLGGIIGGIFGGGGYDDESTSATGGTAAVSATNSAGTSAATSASVSVPVIGASSTTSPAAATTESASSAASASSATPTSASTPSSTSEPSSSSTPSSSSSTRSSASQVIVTVTSILTNSDGSESTMLSSSASAVPVKDNGGGGGPSGKTWGIIGGVVGGVVVLAGLLLVVWRMTQRRFSDLDNSKEDFKWPELQHGHTSSFSPPPETRRTGGAGFEMEKDKFGSEDGDDGAWGSASPRLGANRLAGESAYFADERQAPYEVQYGGAAGMGGQRGSYYDPYLGGPPPHAATSNSYLGPSAAPYPPPPTLPPSPGQNLYPPPPHSSSSSPYLYPETAATNSFSNPHLVPHLHHSNQSAEDVPLTGAAGGAGGIPYRPQAASPGPHEMRY